MLHGRGAVELATPLLRVPPLRLPSYPMARHHSLPEDTPPPGTTAAAHVPRAPFVATPRSHRAADKHKVRLCRHRFHLSGDLGYRG